MNLKLIHTLSNAFGIKMHFCQSDSQWYYIFRPKSCRYIYICYRPFFKIFSTKVYFCRQIFHWFSIAAVITDKNNASLRSRWLHRKLQCTVFCGKKNHCGITAKSKDILVSKLFLTFTFQFPSMTLYCSLLTF